MYPIAANPDNVRSENKEQVGSNQFGNAVPVIGNNAGNQRNDHSQQWNRKGSQVSVANHSSSGKWFNDVLGTCIISLSAACQSILYQNYLPAVLSNSKFLFHGCISL
jgi:hypothetical protein